MAFTSSKWCLLLFVLEVLILVGGHYLVGNGKELERYLCNEKLGEDKTLVLKHSVDYEVSHNGFCIVNATGSIIIKSDSFHFAIVTCTRQNNNTTPHSTAGFAFIDISLVLNGVVFHSCGHLLYIKELIHLYFGSQMFMLLPSFSFNVLQMLVTLTLLITMDLLSLLLTYRIPVSSTCLLATTLD